MDILVAPEYLDVTTEEGTVRVMYELTLGDLLISSLLVLLLLYLIISKILKILWR